MAYDNREVERKLINKFKFSHSTTRSDDHRWLELTLPTLPVVATRFSHTREDIGETLWRRIASQLRVRSHYLNGMIDCSNSKDNYYTQIKTDPYPPWDHSILGTAKRPVEKTVKPKMKKRRKNKRKK